MFRAPEYRKIETVTVTPAELAKWMEVSDDDIKKAYEQRRASYTTRSAVTSNRSCFRT